MSSAATLTNQLLVAMPGMQDPAFASTVTLICEHNADGALGIIINRPLTIRMAGLFEQLKVDDPLPAAAASPVVAGGPVGTERGFVLHDTGAAYDNTVTVSDDIRLTVSRDVIVSLAKGDGPQQSLVAIGYAGWEAGQLEDELRANAWLNVPATKELVFEAPFEDRWALATASLGIDIAQLSPDVGHA